MKKRVNINCNEVWRSPGYPMSQAVAEPDGRRIHLSGQVAWDVDFKVLHVGNAAAQTKAALENIEKVLHAAGGRLDDIVTMTTFYVREEDREAITEARRSVLNEDFGPATIGIQVAQIWEQDLLVEIVATAVIPDDRFQE
jgi:enamine deaminase RidA (YjgF/YER057c/UK114 family)